MQLPENAAVGSLALAWESMQPYSKLPPLVPDGAVQGRGAGPSCCGHGWQINPGWPADQGST